MGWMADKQAEAMQRVQASIAPSVPAGETLHGCIYANQQKRFSVQLYGVGVTDRHLILQPLDRKMNTDGGAVVAARGAIEVGNIFADGAMWSLGNKDQEIRFTANGEPFKLMVLGGSLLENSLAGGAQVDGLQAVVAFLKSSPA